MRHKLLKTANDWNKLILHSDEKVKAEFHTFDNGEVGPTPNTGKFEEWDKHNNDVIKKVKLLKVLLLMN